MEQPSYIVFQCYGHEGIFYECAYALLSLSRLYTPAEMAGWQIWIYTDNPGWFHSFKNCGLPLHFRTVDKETITKWRGEINFVHRVKIEVLIDFTKDKTGNVLYLDTDVVFNSRIDKVWQDIDAGELYMHVMESIVSDETNPVTKKLNAFLHTNKAPAWSGPKALYDMSMWNAGVLGFHTKHKDILQEILDFTDAVYPQLPKHIIEQFACSVMFGRAGDIKTAAPYLLHYWNLKEARLVLASFFYHFKDCSWQDLIKYSALVQMHVLIQEKVNFFSNRSIAGKLQKKLWAPHPYNWNESMKQV